MRKVRSREAGKSGNGETPVPDFPASRLLGFLTGHAAYTRYLAHHTLHHSDIPPLSRRAFFARETERKWSGITRCC